MTTTPPENEQISPDGAWRWDGTTWVPTGQPAQPGQPTQPPAGQAYQQPAYAQPQPVKKSHTGRNILLVIVLLFVLAVGGCFALLAGGANEVSKSIDKSIAQDKEPGGPDNPMEITEGEAFSVSDFDYQAGWSVGNDSLGDVDIKNFKVENNRDDKDSALVEIKFMKGNEVIALADCTSNPIQPGQIATLTCISSDPVPKQYDEITINDTF